MKLALLDRVCAACGVATGYRDAWGEQRAVPIETQLALLGAMGVTVASDFDLEHALEEREAVEHQDKTRFDRAHFTAYGDFALPFEVVYYVPSPGFNVYMDIQQGINLEIYRRFNENGIEFAYPTRSVYVHGAAAPPTG